MIVNLPYDNRHHANAQVAHPFTHDDTILSYLDAVAYSRSLDDGVCSDVNEVTDLHGVIVEVATIRLVRRPRVTDTRSQSLC